MLGEDLSSPWKQNRFSERLTSSEKVRDINVWRETGKFTVNGSPRNSRSFSQDNISLDNGSNNSNNNNNRKQSRNSLLLPPENLLLTSPERSGPSSLSTSPTHSLAPPSLHYRERRGSTSSCDSSVSHNTRRKQRRSSSTNRLSDFADDGKDITLLSFAHSAQAWCSKVGNNCRKALHHVLVRSSPKRPKVVCEAEIIEQVSCLCADYIIHKLTVKELMSRKVGLQPSHWSKSFHVISAGSLLETLYPRTYSNLCRKLSLTMSSPKVVRLTLGSFLEVLFEGEITWGKVVSMFSVAGLFAEECSSQGHADFVKDVVDTVVDFTSHHLLEWLVAQGGWDSFPTNEEDENARLSKLRLLALVGGTTAVICTTSYYFDVW